MKKALKANTNKELKLSDRIIKMAKLKALGSIVSDDNITADMYDKFIDPEDFSLNLSIWEPYCEYTDDWLISQCEAEYNNYINFAESILTDLYI